MLDFHLENLMDQQLAVMMADEKDLQTDHLLASLWADLTDWRRVQWMELGLVRHLGCLLAAEMAVEKVLRKD